MRRTLPGSIARAATGSSSRRRARLGRCPGLRRFRLEPGAHARGRSAGSRGRPGPPARRGPTHRRGPGGDRGPGSSSKSARDARLVGGDARLLGHLEHIELVVRYAASLGERHLGRADVHAAVELAGVGADHLATQGLGEVEARGRTCRSPWARRRRRRGVSSPAAGRAHGRASLAVRGRGRDRTGRGRRRASS